jgi:hypothetical protein
MPSSWFDMRRFDDLERFGLDAMVVLAMDDAFAVAMMASK